MSIVGDLAPGRAAKLHFAFELAAVAACAAFASWTNGATETTGLLLQTLVPAVLWAVGASTLRLHDPYMHRQPLEDAALASVVLLTTAIAVAALGRWPGAGFGIGSNMELYLLLTVTAVLPARWMLFRRLTQREVPANGYDQVLVVGVGPLAACTAEDLAHCGPPRPVIGFVPLSDEPRAAEIPAARIIGAPHDLERLLCERPVTEVIIAGDVVHDGKAMQEVVRTCERLGVCFALPAAPLRLGRGRALLPRLIDDGYLHFSTMRPRPYQLALKRLFDLTASAAALVLLAPRPACLARPLAGEHDRHGAGDQLEVPRDAPAVVLSSLPFYAGMVAQVLFTHLDVTLLSVLSSSTEVGWYGAASNLASLALLLAPLISWVLMPLMSRAAARGEEELLALVRRTLELVLVLAVPTSLALGLGADAVLTSIYGEAFAPAADALRLLSPIFVLTYLCMVAATALVMLGRAWTVTLISAGGLALNALLNLVLIPEGSALLGPSGAGTASALAHLLTEAAIAAALLGAIGARAFDARCISRVLRTGLVAAAVIALDLQLARAGRGAARPLADAAACLSGLFLLKALELREVVPFIRAALGGRHA